MELNNERTLTIIPKKTLEEKRIEESRKVRVAAYARVSTDEEDQINSFNAQKEEYERRIKENPEWEFVKLYSDEGITGTSKEKRKGFMEMINDALAGKIDLILVKVALQNDKLIASSATARADEFITKINKLPYKVTSFDEFNFREVFDRAFVISKTAVFLVIGNSDVSNLNLSSKGDLKVEVKYRIRITDYKMNFYIYINK